MHVVHEPAAQGEKTEGTQRALVFAEPHVIVADTRDNGKPRFIEIFTWVDRSIPESAPENVKAIWQQEMSLCEKRDGQYEIEPNEVELITPSR